MRKYLFFWSSLEGYNDNFTNPTSSSTDFEFPNTNSDQIFSFVLTVSDAEHSISDTINVNYLDNDAPLQMLVQILIHVIMNLIFCFYNLMM